VTIQDLVSPFAAFAAEDLGDDTVTRWRDRVVEPHSDIYRAVESWVNPTDAQERLPALSELHREGVPGLWFSGAADRDGELPGRCGYWLGWDLLDRMLARTPLETAMEWSLVEVSRRLRRLLETLTE
jgi:hypothetical protein